jgi:hypothetical protein
MGDIQHARHTKRPKITIKKPRFGVLPSGVTLSRLLHAEIDFTVRPLQSSVQRLLS